MNTNILVRFLLGLIIFLYAFNIIGIASTIAKKKNYFKIISVLLIGSAIYSVIQINLNKKWTKEDIAIWKNACITTKDSLNLKYPKIYEEYCDCAIEKIMQNMSKDEVYKSKVENLNTEIKYAKGCLIDLFRKTDEKRIKTE